MLTLERYIRIRDFFMSRQGLLKGLSLLNKSLEIMVYLSYVVMAGYCILFSRQMAAFVIFWPAASFVLLSALRAAINAPRPYEKYGLPPLIDKDTKGKSFPSRHVFSVFIIAVTGMHFGYGVSAALLAAGMVIAVTRVISLVHFPRDVIFGALAGALMGSVPFFPFFERILDKI